MLNRLLRVHGKRLPFFVNQNDNDLSRLRTARVGYLVDMATRRERCLASANRLRLLTVDLEHKCALEDVVEFVAGMGVRGGCSRRTSVTYMMPSILKTLEFGLQDLAW